MSRRLADAVGGATHRVRQLVEAAHGHHDLTPIEPLHGRPEPGDGRRELGLAAAFDHVVDVGVAEESQRDVPVGGADPADTRLADRSVEPVERIARARIGPGSEEQARHDHILAHARSVRVPYGGCMRIGMNASDQLARPDLDTIVGVASSAEADGFTSMWLAQTGLVDASAMLGVAGRATSSIELGTAVVPTWPRHPHALAASALTAQAACGGRFVLGIGLSHQPVVEGRYRMTWERPIRHMNDYLDVLLPLLESGAADHEGEIFSYVGEAVRPTTDPPAVMVAALGDQMLRLAGRRTAGTILWCVGPKTVVQQIKPIIDGAAADAGRAAPRIVCSLPVWVTDEPERAREVVGKILAGYAELPSYRAMLDIEGVHGLEDISLIGSHDEVVEGLAVIEASGATDFTAVVMGGNPDETAATRAAVLAAG